MADVDIKTHKEMRTAIRKGDLCTVKRIVGEDVRRLQWSVHPFGSWLHIAASYGQRQIAEWLLAQGMDVNQKAGVFESGPLAEAVSAGHLDVVKCLLEHGAILDTSEPVGNPLFGAICSGHEDVAKFLIEYGIDTSVKYNGPNMRDMDALAFAKEWGQSEIISLLESKAVQRTDTAPMTASKDSDVASPSTASEPSADRKQ